MEFKNISVCLLICLGILQIVNSSKLTKGGSHDIKKILVIGATGQAGSRMVKEALDRGLQVRAFSRNPNKLSEDIKDKVEAVAGDIQNYDDVQKAVKGVDAVIVAISPRSYEDTSKYMAKGVQNVVKAMKAENVEIINVLLSVFVIMPVEEIPQFYRLAIEDQHAMLEAVQNSDLKYIASCPPNFITSSFDAYEAKVGGMPGGKNFNGGINVISLNQLAKYFIDSLSEPRYYGKLVGVRNKVERKQGVKA